MPPDVGSYHWRRLLPLIALLVWVGGLGSIVVRVAIWPQKNNCFVDHYRPAGQNWLNGADLYSAQADTCRYSPMIHAVLAPFSMLSDRWGSVAWRIATGFALFAAMLYWLRAACPAALNAAQRAAVLLCAVPLSIGSLNNGQGNVPMMAGILIGTAAICRQRWNLAAAALALACLVKIYPIALVLLLVVVCPKRFALRFGAAMAIGLLLPFALQDPSYVARQYLRWFGNLRADDRSAWDLTEAYRDAWMLIRISGLGIGVESYRWIQVGTGCSIGLLCAWMARRGDSGRDLINRVLALGCCWMAAFGPATESPTYILLAAPLAWLLVESWRGALPTWTRPTTTAAAILFFGTVIAVSMPIGRAVLARGPQPAAALLLLATLVVLCLNDPARETIEPGMSWPSTDRNPAIPNEAPAAREKAA